MEFNKIVIKKNLIVIGAGIPGICAAVQAARLGLSVALINNRGYLGGNSSAEIGVCVQGACGMQEFNFYSRESGIIEELLLENMYRNSQGNRYIWDSVLIDFVRREKNIEVFLNTTIDKVVVSEEGAIQSVAGSQQGSEKRFGFYGQNFIDNTGDGTVGFLSGLEFRVGREGQKEFGERIAPEEPDSYVLPSTLVFYAKDTGKPVRYIAPEFAVDLTKTGILDHRIIPADNFFQSQWYYELGGQLDQIGWSQQIIQMHRELVYGIWDYIKNSGRYDSGNYNLEYVSCIPGKRESRRLVGEYILKEDDIVNQKDFDDVVGYGGWSIDLHAIDGFYSKEVINKHFFLKGVYQIPFRTIYSRKVNNLLIVGRCMSVSHVAFGSTRVMATLGTLGQAAGAAAYLCGKYSVSPQEIYENHIKELQQLLLRYDQQVIGKKLEPADDMAVYARVSVSSVKSCSLENADEVASLNEDLGLIVPVRAEAGSIFLLLRSDGEETFCYSIYQPVKKENYNPEQKIADGSLKLSASHKFQWVELQFSQQVDTNKIFIEIRKNEKIQIGLTRDSITGIISLEKQKKNSPSFVDIETLEPKEYLWSKLEHSICFRLSPKQDIYGSHNLVNGFNRPYGLPNLWVSDNRVKGEYILLDFMEPKTIREVVLLFDSNHNYMLRNNELSEFDAFPQLVKDYTLYYRKEGIYKVLKEVKGNYQRVNRLQFGEVTTDSLKVVFEETNGSNYVSVFEISVYR